MQNWLDPAKEIKKQIRSKFVIICLFQGVWKTFILVYWDSKTTKKHLPPNCSLCLRRHWTPMAPSRDARGKGGSLAGKHHVAGTRRTALPSPSHPLHFFLNHRGNSPLLGRRVHPAGMPPAPGAWQPPSPSPAAHGVRGQVGWGCSPLLHAFPHESMVPPRQQSLFYSHLSHSVLGLWQRNCLDLLGVLPHNECRRFLRLVTREFSLLKTT